MGEIRGEIGDMGEIRGEDMGEIRGEVFDRVPEGRTRLTSRANPNPNAVTDTETDSHRVPEGGALCASHRDIVSHDSHTTFLSPVNQYASIGVLRRYSESTSPKFLEFVCPANRCQSTAIPNSNKNNSFVRRPLTARIPPPAYPSGPIRPIRSTCSARSVNSLRSAPWDAAPDWLDTAPDPALFSSPDTTVRPQYWSYATNVTSAYGDTPDTQKPLPQYRPMTARP